MTQINPPSLQLPGAPTTTTVSGKTATPGPGTLQLTDENGNSYFVDVDANGNYSTTVPTGNFQPTRMTLRTGSVKAAWDLKDGKWTQIASAAGSPGTQGAMAPGRGSAQSAGQQFALLDDECKQYALVGSLDHGSGLGVAQLGRSPLSPLLLPVRFAGGMTPVHPNPAQPLARLVSDPLPPDAIREAQKQGIDHADQEFEKAQLEKIPRGSRTKEQTDRLDKLNDMLKDYENTKNNPFANKEVVDTMEKAAAARRLQRQAAALRASGDLNQIPTANGLDASARSLMGNQPLPPLRASAAEPLQWANAPTGTTGAMAPTTPGGTPSATAIGQRTTYVIKGTARMGSGVALPRGTLVSGVMMMPRETPEHYVQSTPATALGLPDMTTGVAAPPGDFMEGDDKAPPATEVGANGAYHYDYKVGLDYGLGKNLALGVEYKAVFSAGVNYGCAKQSFTDLAAGKEMPTTAIEDRTQLIKGLSPRANLWQVDDAFVQNGLGHVQGWDPWESPNTAPAPRTWFSYKIVESDIPKFNRIGSTYFDVIGSNFGINTAPAPAWKPENWPDSHPRGIPRASVNRKGGRP